MDKLQDLWNRAQMGLGTSALLAVGALCVLLYAFAWCRIYSKAGHHGALGLVMLIPGVNLIMLTTLALGRWPIEREVAELRDVRKAVHRADRRRLRRIA